VVLTAVLAGHRESAIAACRKRIEQSPDTVNLYLELGEMYLAGGKAADAAAVAEQGIRAKLRDPRLEILAAVALGRAGRGSDVKPHLDRALDMETRDPFVLNNLAYLLVENGGDLDAALRLAQRARRISPDEPHFTDTLGWIYLKKQKTAAALEIFGKLAGQYPHNSTYHYHLGSALVESGDKAKARQELQSALSEGPDAANQGAIREMLASLR
jgi:Flp pilus assembly protein TadD